MSVGPSPTRLDLRVLERCDERPSAIASALGEDVELVQRILNGLEHLGYMDGGRRTERGDQLLRQAG